MDIVELYVIVDDLCKKLTPKLCVVNASINKVLAYSINPNSGALTGIESVNTGS